MIQIDLDYTLHKALQMTKYKKLHLVPGKTSLNGYYRATFTSANARRYFFNAGGRITFPSKSKAQQVEMLQKQTIGQQCLVILVQ